MKPLPSIQTQIQLLTLTLTSALALTLLIVLSRTLKMSSVSQYKRSFGHIIYHSSLLYETMVKPTSLVWKKRLYFPNIHWHSHWCCRVRCASCCFRIETTNYTCLFPSNTTTAFTFFHSLTPFSRRSIWIAITFQTVPTCKSQLTCCQDPDDICDSSTVILPSLGPSLPVPCDISCTVCYDHPLEKVSRPA